MKSTHKIIEEMIQKAKEQNLSPPFYIASKEPIDISGFPEIKSQFNHSLLKEDTIHLSTTEFTLYAKE